MVLQKQRINSSYPRCAHPEEDTTYVLQCQCEGIYEVRECALIELKIWMKPAHTQTDIEYFIFHIITSWLSNGDTIS